MLRLIVIPAWRTFCWISCARSGISKPFQPASWTRNPSSWPAAASSSFALRTSCWRWATSLAVEGKTGANGLSLPKSDFVSSRPSTRSRRLTSSAIAWRVRLSLNCSVELLRWTWRWAEALQLDRADVRVGQQRLAARDRELHEDVDLVAEQAEDLRLLVRVEADLGLVADRDPALVPVLAVRDVAHALAGPEARALPRPGADERLLPVAVVGLREDDRVVVVRADEEREVAVRRVELELHRGARRAPSRCPWTARR